MFDDFGRHFWSLGDLLGGIGASFSLSGFPGDPWELQGPIFMDFGSNFGGPWEVSFHVFFHHKFNVDFEVDFGMDFKHIFMIF